MTTVTAKGRITSRDSSALIYCSISAIFTQYIYCMIYDTSSSHCDRSLVFYALLTCQTMCLASSATSTRHIIHQCAIHCSFQTSVIYVSLQITVNYHPPITTVDTEPLSLSLLLSQTSCDTVYRLGCISGAAEASRYACFFNWTLSVKRLKCQRVNTAVQVTHVDFYIAHFQVRKVKINFSTQYQGLWGHKGICIYLSSVALKHYCKFNMSL